MHITQVSPTSIYPPVKGGDHRSHGLLTEFVRSQDTISRFCQSGPVSRSINDEKRVLKISENYTEYRGNSNPVHDLARSPALFGFPYVLCGPAARFNPSSTLLNLIADSDYIFVEGPWQVSAISQTNPDAQIIYSSHNVEFEMYSSMYQNRAVQSAVNEIVRRVESHAIDLADATICTSSRDLDKFLELYDSDAEYIIAPNGIAADEVVTPTVSPKERSNILNKSGLRSDTNIALFVGSGHQPNVEAARELSEIADKCARRDMDIQFLIVGSVCESLEKHEHLVQVGFVDDLEPYYAISDIAVNPVISGGGSNIKILEYMAKSLPVISTPFGSRGFDFDHQSEIVVATLSEFPEQIENILLESEYRRRIAKSSQEAVADRYTWRNISSDLRKELGSI